MASKPDAVIIQIARDIQEFRKATERDIAGHDKRLKRVEETLEEVLTSIKQVQITQTAQTNALTSTLSELALIRKLEGRVDRLESAVFRKD